MPKADEQIRRAMEEGQFEDLPGKGRPLNLEEDPFEDPEWRMAHHILRSSGYSLPWIELRREIEADLDVARRKLALAWEQQREDPQRHAERWKAAQAAFQEAVAEINKRIFNYNLEAPSMQLQMMRVEAQAEVKRLMEG